MLLPNLRSLVAEVIVSRRLETLEEKCIRNKADLLGVLVEQLDDNDIRFTSTITAAVYTLHRPEHREWLAKARKEAEDTNVGNDIPLDQLRSTMPLTIGIGCMGGSSTSSTSTLYGKDGNTIWNLAVERP